jgi:branched-chain amino acid transport system ATP-binding protein
MTEPILQIRGLNASYGDLQVLREINLDVFAQEVIAIIGANGAGKTTLLRCIAGLHKSRSGTIRFQDQDILHLPPHHLIYLGLVEVPDERGIFPDLTVEKNLMAGGFSLKRANDLKSALERIYGMFPILEERKNFFARSLSGGEQQMLALGKGMMTNPKLLILDEPSSGLAPVMVNRLMGYIQRIHSEGTTLLLVEQNVYQALGMAHRAYLMENGRIVLKGSNEELLRNDRVRKAYLGR